MIKHLLCFIAWLCFAESASILEDTVFVILSQNDEHHAKLALETKVRLESTAQASNKPIGGIYDATKDLHQHGAWAIFPLILHLKQRKVQAKWFVFLDVDSSVDLNLLETVLTSHQSDHFIGYELVDSSHTIIHHFQEPRSLKYPNFPCGFALSGSLIEEVGFSLEQHGRGLDWLPSDFSIDAQFELAKALHTRDPRHVLVHEPGFCIKKKEDCAIFPGKAKNYCKSENTIEDLNEQTLFAIKTCQKYHVERLPVIKSTWAPFAQNTLFASDLSDSNLQTVQLEAIENTERGHCAKTMAIIKHFHQLTQESTHWKWLVIADDDTILSVYRLLDYLQCYDPDQDIHLGQRYGFRIAYGSHGYDYITGGGAMIFSKAMVHKIIQSPSCKCTSNDAPDDMHIGACLGHLSVTLIHSPRFHQARPEDYAEDYLRTNEPISFHKFWNTDPHKVYDTWFRSSDEKHLLKKAIQHEEL